MSEDARYIPGEDHDRARAELEKPADMDLVTAQSGVATPEQMLRELLAVILGDGGQMVTALGLAGAVRVAHERVHAMDGALASKEPAVELLRAIHGESLPSIDSIGIKAAAEFALSRWKKTMDQLIEWGKIDRDILRAKLRVKNAEALADEVAVLTKRKIIDERSPAADALLDFRDPEPPVSERADRLAILESQVDAAKRLIDEARVLKLSGRKCLQGVFVSAERLRKLIEGDAVIPQSDRVTELEVRSSRAESQAAYLQVQNEDAERLIARVMKERDDLQKSISYLKGCLAKTLISVKLTADNGMPAFGAFLEGTAKEGTAEVLLNFEAHLGAIRDCDGGAVEVKAELAKSLAHELFHACQELLGKSFDESEVEAALTALDPNTEPVEPMPAGFDDMIQRLTGELDEVRRNAEPYLWAQKHDAFIQFSDSGRKAYVTVGTFTSRTYDASFPEAVDRVRKSMKEAGHAG